VKEVSSDEIERAVFNHFNNYMATAEESKSTSFEVYSDFSKKGKSGIDVFYHTLNKIFDASKDQLDKHLRNYIVEFAKSKVIESKQLGFAICKYLKEYADRVVDFPLLKEYLAKLVATLIMTDSALKPQDLNLFDFNRRAANEDELMFEEYFNIMAQILAEIKLQSAMSWSEVSSLFSSTPAKKQLE
jgi:hypothetical protein